MNLKSRISEVLTEGPEMRATLDNIAPRKPHNKMMIDGVKVYYDDNISPNNVKNVMQVVMRQLAKYKLEFLARRNAIYFADHKFTNGFASSMRNIVQIDFNYIRDPLEIARVVVHELGHKLLGVLTHRNFIAMQKFKDHPEWRVTGYAHTNADEFFCELFSYYVCDYEIPEDAEAWMRKVIMNYARSHS